MRADGQQIAAGEFLDFTDVTETSTHDLGRVAEFFVIGINLLHGNHAGIFGGRKILFLLRLIPVHDAADERRNQLHLRLGARDGLREREKQGEVAVDAVALENFRRADAFPRRGDLDEDAFAPDAVLRVKLDEVAAFGDQRVGVERHMRIGLGGDAAGHNLQNFQAK